jgi:hypothetical protein
MLMKLEQERGQTAGKEKQIDRLIFKESLLS